jgi:pimeloyl-ACP methyl ester carboxylesterase
MFFTSHGHNIYVEDWGDPDAPVVLLLHHGLGAARAWKAQIPVLVAHGWRVIVYDRWGYGKSDPRPALALPDFTPDLADLEELIALLKIEKLALVGHSDGGKIAMLYTLRRPDRVTQLLLVSTHVYIEEKMGVGIQEVRQNYTQDADFRGKMHKVHGDKADQVFENWFEGWLAVGKQAGQGWDLRPQISKITCPVLVMQGLLDEHATPQHARDIAQAIPGARLRLAPGVGHMLPQDAEDLFNAEMLAFLNADKDTRGSMEVRDV